MLRLPLVLDAALYMIHTVCERSHLGIDPAHPIALLAAIRVIKSRDRRSAASPLCSESL